MYKGEQRNIWEVQELCGVGWSPVEYGLSLQQSCEVHCFPENFVSEGSIQQDGNQESHSICGMQIVGLCHFALEAGRERYLTLQSPGFLFLCCYHFKGGRLVLQRASNKVGKSVLNRKPKVEVEGVTLPLPSLWALRQTEALWAHTFHFKVGIKCTMFVWSV